MKKYVLAAISLVLLVSTFFFPSELLNPMIYAGEGDGQNAEVRNMEEILEVMEFFNSSSHGSDEAKCISQSDFEIADLDVLAPGELFEDADAKEKTVEHTSVTVHEDTLFDYVYYSDSMNRDTRRTVQFSRSLTVYMTEDASYYESKGTYFDSGSGGSQTHMIFDIQIYEDSEKTLLRFNQMECVYMRKREDGYKEIKEPFKNKNLLGRWIMLPAGCADNAFSLLDNANRDMLSTIGGYIEDAIEDERLVHDGNRYKVLLTGLEKDDISIMVDLSDAENPYIELIQDGKGEHQGEYIEAYVFDNLTFGAINNTVIDIKDAVESVLEYDTFNEFVKALEG